MASRECLPIVLSLCLVALIAAKPADKPIPKRKSCNSFTKVDTCMQKLLLLGDPKFKFPVNRSEMNDHCKLVVGYEKCVKDYASKCLETFPRQVTNVLAYGVAKTNKGYCSSSKRKEQFISLGTCGNAIKDKGDQCMQTYIETLLGIENVKEDKDKMPMVCCHYFKMKQCIIGLTQKQCTQQQTVEAERLVDGYAQETLNLICGDYTEENDKCDSIYGKEVKALATQKRSASLLPSFINILSNFD